MASDERRLTRFGEGKGSISKDLLEDTDIKRRTKFSGGAGLLPLSLGIKASVGVKQSAKEDSVQAPRLPLKASHPTCAPSKPPPTRNESPWSTYTRISPLERGGEIMTACTRAVPVKMVAVKKLVADKTSSELGKELTKCQHKNLLSALEVYKYEHTFFIITDYTAATLKQILGSSSCPLQESQVSAICYQGGLSLLAVASIANAL